MDTAKVSMRRCARAAAVALVLAAAAVTAPSALAQEPGVVYEPGSPSEKEYAIPLEEVRNDAGGRQPGRIEPLAFGIGLSRKDAGSGGRSAGEGAERSDGAPGGGAQGAGGAGAADRSSSGFAERLAEAEDAGAPVLWKLGPLLLVLLPALIVAVLLARRERERPAAA